MGKDRRQTSTQTLDPGSQAYVDQIRRFSQGAASDTMGGGPLVIGPDGRPLSELIAPFLNPYQDQVIGGVRAEADRQRGMARRGVTDMAIRAGAQGGSRHGVAEGIRLGEIDRNELQTVGGLMSQGFQNALGQGLQYSEYQRALREQLAREPLLRRQFAQQFYTGGLGPVGQTQTQTQEGSLVGDIAGLGLIGAGLFTGNPTAAGAGASVAGGGSGFQPPSFFPTAKYNPFYMGQRY